MKKEDENIENQLGNFKKGLPFRIPENYFENFSGRLMTRIEAEEQAHKRGSISIYVKPILMIAASFVLVLMVVSGLFQKSNPSRKAYLSNNKSNTELIDSADFVPTTLISDFSEGQFLAAVSDMKEMESDTIQSDRLGDFIASNYSEYEIIASN